MSIQLKSLVLGLGLVAGLGVAAAGIAQAQTAVAPSPVVPGPSIANLPPPGPKASSENNIPRDPQMPVTASGRYLGPDPGVGYYGTYNYQKPADWDQRAWMHPYAPHATPSPN